MSDFFAEVGYRSGMAEKKRGPGRPQMDPEERRGPRITVRVREDEREVIERAALEGGGKPSEMMREEATARAASGFLEPVEHGGYRLRPIPIPSSSGGWIPAVRIMRTGAEPAEFASGRNYKERAKVIEASIALGVRIIQGKSKGCKAP